MKHLKNQILNMRFLYILLSIVFINAACTDKKADSMKDLDAIRSKSTYQVKKDTVIVVSTLGTLLPFYNQDSVGLNIQSIESDSNRFFFHEFNYVTSAQYSLTDSSQRVFKHQFARFKIDTTNVKNNFFNWFDKEFSQRDSSIRIYDRMNIFPKHIFFVCTNQSIHVIKSDSKIQIEKWIRYIQQTEKKVKFIYICHQPKNKEALWYNYEKKKLTLISEE